MQEHFLRIDSISIDEDNASLLYIHAAERNVHLQLSVDISMAKDFIVGQTLRIKVASISTEQDDD